MRDVATETGTRWVTAQELLERSGRCELIEGVVTEMEPAGAAHGRIALRVGSLIDRFAAEHGGLAFAAETGFQLAAGPDTVRAPDAAYVAQRAEAVGETPAGYWPGAPDLALEVVSPPDTYTSVQGKALHWLAAGAGVVLVVDPAAGHVTRYRGPDDVTVHAAEQPVDCAPAMPGFAPTAAALLGAD